MTDWEMLKFAAKAAGITLVENGKDIDGHPWYWSPELSENWDPLMDDGDALRLAVKLRLDVSFLRPNGVATPGVGYVSFLDADPYAATRRAIVRAAAEIGKGMV